MAWSKVGPAGVILVGSAVSMAYGCLSLGHDHENPSDPFTPRHMVARIRAFAREHDIVKRAQAGEKAPYSWIDTDRMVCLYGKHSETDGKLGGDVLWRPSDSYKLEERYMLIALFCFEHKLFYYRFISEDRRTDAFLGPYTVETIGQPFDGNRQ